ncbi:MAG: AAA family ATPase [Alicyclobacillus sp.]|nr:AAA family ATPase [Alicyclobacillus sp.]
MDATDERNPNRDESERDPAFAEEQHRLQTTLRQVRAMLGRLEGIPRQFTDDPSEPQTADEVAQQAVELLREEQMDALRRAASEPYFGRIDIQDMDSVDVVPYYIGKRGIEDSATGDRLVLDWRAPLASVFYSFSGQGLARYEAPDGVLEVDVHRKRNLAIRGGQLQRVVDSYVKGRENLNVTDEFLLYRLTENKDNRLRDIVSTIQAEQDRIIRADRNLAIVIQGVAGSGKTTVALHRIAYLLYQHKDRMRTDRMVIFAPNAMFVDYISEVLPELGVGGIRQTTFAKWALERLGFRVVLDDAADRMETWFSVHRQSRADALFAQVRGQGALAFAEDMERQLADLERGLVPEGPFEPWDGAVLDEETIRRWFFEEYRHYPLAKRRERVLARVKRWMETAYRDVKAEDRGGAKKKSSGARYRAYAKRWPELDAYAVYRQLVSGPAKPKSRGGRPVVQPEDLAPLVYLHTRLFGVDGTETFDHVVIDEAQDFSPLQLAVLRMYCPSDSFTILGDLSQSIHAYQGISRWEEFLEQFPDGVGQFFRLDVSYRSTMEIIEFANEVIRPFEQFTQAVPVFRSGEPVAVVSCAAADRTTRMVEMVRDLVDGADTVAVLTRTQAEAGPVHAALVAAGMPAHQITAGQERYEGGISVLPVYLAKGLEFDAVVLVDVDAAHYDRSPLSAKLLYVGCTRALHRLAVLTNDNPSPLLAEAGARERTEVV